MAEIKYGGMIDSKIRQDAKVLVSKKNNKFVRKSSMHVIEMRVGEWGG